MTKNVKKAGCQRTSSDVEALLLRLCMQPIDLEEVTQEEIPID